MGNVCGKRAPERPASPAAQLVVVKASDDHGRDDGRNGNDKNEKLESNVHHSSNNLPLFDAETLSNDVVRVLRDKTSFYVQSFIG